MLVISPVLSLYKCGQVTDEQNLIWFIYVKIEMTNTVVT